MKKKLIVDQDGTLRWVADVSPVLKSLKEERETTKGWSKSRNMRKVADIPVFEVQRWASLYGDEFVRELFADTDKLIEFLKKYHPHYLI